MRDAELGIDPKPPQEAAPRTYPETKPGEIPRQYAKPQVNKAAVQDDDQDDSDSSDLNLTDKDVGIQELRAAFKAVSDVKNSDQRTVYGRMARMQVVNVRCNLVEVEAKGLHSLRHGWYISTTDGGADTMILGKGWLKQEIDPHRTARIIGFDHK